jgi:hypothetical protein
MNITQKGKLIYIDQKSYITKIVKQCKLENSNPVSTPLPSGYVPLENQNPIDESLKSQYQSILGSILWIMLGSRLDIAFATVKMAQFTNNPSQEHLDKLRWIVKYLNSTQHFRIVYNGESNSRLIAYCDSDHASDPNHQRSQMGNILFIANRPVTWKSTVQRSVATSSTEAEYVALCECTKQTIWI